MKKMKHYLITIPLNQDWVMHGYVMTSKPDKIIAVIELMLDRLKAVYDIELPMPVIMQTELENGGGLPREVARENPEAAKLMDEATDIHYTVWLMQKEDRRFAPLMGLH